MAKSKSNVKVPTIKGSDSLSEVLAQFIGQPIAMLCARFTYRGILSSVGSDHVVIAQARAVESSGASSQEQATTEDVVGGSIIITLNSVETFYWPNWVDHSLDY